MELPRDTAAPAVRVRFGRYVARRLKRAGFGALAEDATRVTAAVKSSARALEDALELVEDALANRDVVDDTLDTASQDGRNRLAGRGVDAMQTAPYTRIFPEGIGYYIAAPLDAQVQRYQELRARVTEHLPPDDAVRVALLAALDQGLAGWQDAVAALVTARANAALAAGALDQTTDAWTRQMERIYGALVAEVGKTAARRFFPRARASGGKRGDAEPLGA